MYSYCPLCTMFSWQKFKNTMDEAIKSFIDTKPVSCICCCIIYWYLLLLYYLLVSDVSNGKLSAGFKRAKVVNAMLQKPVKIEISNLQNVEIYNFIFHVL